MYHIRLWREKNRTKPQKESPTISVTNIFISQTKRGGNIGEITTGIHKQDIYAAEAAFD